MASFFTRVADKLTPWDRKGEVQRRSVQQRKKRDEEEARRSAPTIQRQDPNSQDVLNRITPKAQKPRNIFENLNQGLAVQSKPPQTAIPVEKTPETLAVKPPQPGTVIKPKVTAQAITTSNKANVVKRPAELDMRNRRVVPRAERQMSNVETGARSAGATLTNLAGGVVGAARSVAETPALIANAPNLVKLQAAKSTGNIEARSNAEKSMANNKVANWFTKKTAPVTNLLKKAESETDKAGRKLAPWQEEYQKNVTKAATNIIPVGAVVSGGGKLSKLSKLKKGQKLEAEAEVTVGTPGTIGVVNKIPVKEVRNIAVDTAEEAPQVVNVRNTTPRGEIIREIGGDAPNVTKPPTPAQAKEDKALRNFQNQNFGKPDDRIEGVTPRTPGSPSLVTRADKEAELKALDDALESKEINKTQHKEAVKAVESTKAVDEAPQGQKITVKTEDSIPVIDKTVIPRNLPETPGRVRLTTKTDPQAAKTQLAVKNTPALPPIPKVGTVMPDGTKVTKRQVERIKNQNKLAKKMVKEQEKNAELLEKVESSRPGIVPGQSDGFAPTGELAKGRKGNIYEKANFEAEKQAGRQEMKSRAVEDLVDELSGRTSMADADPRRIKAAMENLAKADPDGYTSDPMWQILNKRFITDRTRVAQILSMGERAIRKSASAETLNNRWYNKLVRVSDEPSRITDSHFKAVRSANDSFTQARDNAARLAEQYKRTGSQTDLDAFKQAIVASKKADTKSRTVEARVAEDVLKGQKGADAAKIIDDLRGEADLNMMNAPTASQLSGPATGFRNLFGTEASGVENMLGANLRAKIVSKIPFFKDANVGGFDTASAIAGRKEGASKFASDIARRSVVSGRNPIKHTQNWATSLNSAGESSMAAQSQGKLGAYYKRQLQQQGIDGDQLKRDTEFLRLTDPDGMEPVFMDSVMKSSGLTGVYQKSKQIENSLSDWMTSELGQIVPASSARAFSNFVTRIGLGYPTATGNFVLQSGKRLGLGLPSAIETGLKLARGDKVGAAMSFDSALKEFGSGSAMWGLGAALGAADLISGSYPEDEGEQARWEREGISENSIRVGDAWYPIPQGLGMFGLPIMTAAALGRGGWEEVAKMYEPKHISKLLPTDQVQSFLKLMSGEGTESQEKNFIASTIRTGLPLGSLFNQVAKGLDPTKNDTTTKDFWNNVFDQLVTGIPGQHKFADIPDKLTDEGTPITNPNFLQVMTGASTAVQGGGEELSQEMQTGTNEATGTLADLGVFEDETLKGILKGEDAGLYTKASQGKELNEKELETLQKALVKGVSEEGTDTAYLENGQYDTHLRALNLKRELMKSDPTIAPSKIKKMDVAITRGEVYRDNQIPYEIISEYQDVGVEEWRKMGDPDSDEYNADMYEKLYDIDQLMTSKKVSYKKGNTEKAKYYDKTSKGKGRGGSGGKYGPDGKMTTEFGTLQGVQSGPKVQQYDNIETKVSGVPRIGIKRPNIVHKITRSE